MKLTFYLFNDSVKEFDQAVNQSKLSSEDAFKELLPTQPLPFEAKAYFQENRPTTPKWLNFLSSHFSLDPESIHNSTNSFLLLVKAKERVFAATTGFGFTALDRAKLESGFGLRVTLNEVDPQKIKGIDVRKIDTSTKQKRVLINRNSPLFDFDFDLDEDLLNLISGQPRDESLAKKLAGADSLSLTADFQLQDIGQKCEALLQSFMNDNYKDNFAFIDHLKLIKDQMLLQELDLKLAEAFSSRQAEKLMLAYPDLDNLSQVEQFRLSYGRAHDLVEEVDLAAIYEFWDIKKLSDSDSDVDLHKLFILGLDHDGNAVTKKFTLYEYAVYETYHAGKRYIFSLSRWFELANEYVRQVDQDISTIEEIAVPDFLPSMKRRQREDTYNQLVAKSGKYALLDKVNFPAGGPSKIEVCDLLSPQSEFICVKKYNGSSTLSHLFSQGFVSATLLEEWDKYRHFVLEKCPKHWPKLFDADNLDKTQITFVFAIASETNGGLAESLPFFSKVNLRQARKAIQKLGFKVKVYKINLK